MFYKLRLFVRKILYFFLNTAQYKDNVKISGFSRGLQNVIFEGKNAVPDRCNFSGNIKIGYATTLGYNNVIFGNVSIGKYCQLGFDVALHATNHPIHYLSTYINSNLFEGELVKLKSSEEIIVGNDVWIGHNAIIVGNVRIGNGAIIAAGSVVTKDVLPYTIVAGVPAKFVKKRFTDEVIEEVENLEWWNKEEKQLEDLKPFFLKNYKNKKSIYD